MSTEEDTFKTRDGTPLYTKTWKPSTPSPLHLIFLHGFSDHINAYYNFFPTLSSPSYNITVHGFDQRGWGRSVNLATNAKSTRGLTGDSALVLSDIHDFILHVSKSIASSSSSSSSSSTSSQSTPTSTPKLFLMGHSMGGAEALIYTLATPKSSPLTPSLPLSITGLLLESPHVAFPAASQPSSLLVISGRFASKLMPNMQMVQKLDSSAMCRDPKVCQDWDADELCHDTGTLRGLAGLLDRAGGLDSLGRGNGDGGKKIGGVSIGERLSVPVFWAHGTADQVCDFQASSRLFGVVNRGKQRDGNEDGEGYGDGSVFKAYAGGFHKIHGEPNGMGEDFANDIGGWILGVAGAGKNGVEGKGQTGGLVTGMDGVDQNEQQMRQTGDTTTTDEAIAPEDPENVKSRL